MTAVGFEPTQLALVELESTPLDHSGKLSLRVWYPESMVDAGTRGAPLAEVGAATAERQGSMTLVCLGRARLAGAVARRSARLLRPRPPGGI